MIVPFVEFPPVTPPTCQVTSVFEFPVTAALNCCVCPSCRFTTAGETNTVIPETIETLALARYVVLACEITVTVTVLGFGTVAGGVYKPVDEIVPYVEFPPAMPLTCHVTAVLIDPEVVSVNWSVAPRLTEALKGLMVT